MAITVSVDHAIVSNEGTSIISNSFTPVTDDVLFVCVTVDDTTEGDITGISDDRGNTYVQTAEFTNGNRRVRLYHVVNPGTLALVTTVTFGSATDAYLDLFTLQGVNTTTISDITATSNANNTAPDTAITPNASSGCIIWLVHQSSNSTYTVLGSGQSERGMAAVGGAEKSSCLFTTEIFTAAPGNQTATASKSANWIGLAVEIVEAAGGTNFERSVSQTLTHSESVIREGSTFVRAPSQNLLHSSITIREGSTFERTGTTVLTHIDSATRALGKVRTVTQTLIHIDSVIREGSAFVRAVAQLLTHSSVIIREFSTFVRTATQILTHSEVVTSETTAAPEAVARRPAISARRPLQPLAPEIIESRTTVFLKCTLFRKELVSTTITNTIHLKLHQRESITTKLQAPDQWLAKDHTSNAIKLVLKKKDKLFNTFRLKLRESLNPSQEAQMRLRNAKTLQDLRDSLKDKDKRIKSLADHILKLIAIKNLQADQLQELQTSLVKLKEGTMSADDVLALFATSN